MSITIGSENRLELHRENAVRNRSEPMALAYQNSLAGTEPEPQPLVWTEYGGRL